MPPPPANFLWRVRATSKATAISEDDVDWSPWSPQRRFRSPPPSSFRLRALDPPNGAAVSAGARTLRWEHPSGNLFYWEIQVSGDRAFNTDPATATSFVWWNLVHGGVTVPLNSWTTPPLEVGSYYWRVRPRVQGDGFPVGWSETFRFMVAVATPTPSPTLTATPTRSPTPTRTPTATRTPIP